MSAARAFRATVSLTAFVPLLAGTVHARSLDLPVRVAVRDAVAAPAYLGDRLCLRLVPSAARRMTARRVDPGARGASGVAALDLAARSLGGVWFEPEFRGEVPPPEGSGRTDFTTFYLAHLPEGADLGQALDVFAALPEVAAAEPIPLTALSAVPNDSLWGISDWFYNPPSRRDLHAPEAWDLTTGDTSIVVAIIDTGLIPYHPEIGGRVPGLAGQLWTNWAERVGRPGVDDDGNGFVDDVWGWDFVDLSPGSDVRPGEDGYDEDGDPNDFVGHGTEVAGIVGAIADNGSGVAGTVWKARLMTLRAGWAAISAPLGELSMSYAAQAVRYATRMGARVINCSFSTLPSLELDAAISDAAQAGVLVVVAAGNYGTPNAIGSRQDVLSVGATDRDDVAATWSNLSRSVDLCAPGVSVSTLGIARPGTDSLGLRQPGYARGAGGTSFAAPFASGAAALVQARRLALGLPLLDPMTLVLHLRETTDDISAANPGLHGYGTGRLDIERAVASAPAPGSRVVRTPGGLVGGPVVLPRSAGGDRIAMVTSDGALVIVVDVTGEVARVVPLPGKPVSALTGAELGGSYGAALFVALDDGEVAGYLASGDPLPGWPVSSGRPFSLGIALGDLDADGEREVIAARPEGLQVWHADGRPMMTWNAPAALCAAVALADLDGVPGMEVIAVDRGNMVHALGLNGSELARWPVWLGNGYYTPAAPVVARFGTKPTVIVADGTWLTALRPDGSVRFRAPLWNYTAVDPALADMNGDGSDEVVVASGSYLAAFDSMGVVVWAPAGPYAPYTQNVPVVATLTGTRAPAVVIASSDELMAFGRAGDALRGFPKPGGGGTSPTVWNRSGGGAGEILAGPPDESLFFMYDLGPGSWSATAHPWPTARGDFARSGSHNGVTGITPSDSVPPEPVTDLRAGRITAGVELTWTAPAEGGAPPRAASYEMRWATHPLGASNFTSGRAVTGLPTPLAAGAPERMVVSNLQESQTYFFALRSRDASWNVSQLSNVVSDSLPLARPARIGDLQARVERDATVTLEWTAVGDDSLSGRPARYLVRGAGQAFDPAGFEAAPIRGVAAANVDAGATERTVGTGMPLLGPLWFAVMAEDDLGQRSEMSDLVAVPFAAARPARIANFVMESQSDAGIALGWTAVGDDSLIGRPTRYLVRAAPVPLDEGSFASAPIARIAAATVDAGSRQYFTLSGLTLGEPLWIGVEAEDDLGLVSSLSNVITTSFVGYPPNAVKDLRVEARVDSGFVLRWSESGDDGASGRSSRYRLAADTIAVSEATFANAPFRLEVPATATRSTQSAALRGLPLGRRVFVALKAVDDIGAQSPISNLVAAEAVLVRPAPVADLAVVSYTDSTLTLGWTAVGDDSLTGRLANYAVRADPEPIEERSFESAKHAWITSGTVYAGAAEVVTLTGLPAREPLYFAIEGVDDAGNSGALSNLALGTIVPRPPQTVSDLTVEEATEHALTLRWTASGDDGLVGRPLRYLLRGGPDPITPPTFDGAPIAETIPAAVAGGGTERFQLTDLPFGQRLWFALEAEDRAGARSGLSNLVSAMTIQVPPAAVADLSIQLGGDSSASLRWTATGDDGTVGRPRLYRVRGATAPLDDAGFEASTLAREVQASVDAGGEEHLLMTGLPPGTRLWFAVKAVDSVGSVSPLSNVVSARTGVGGPLSGKSGLALAALLQPSRPPVLLYWQSDEAGEPNAHTIALFDLSGRCVRRLSVGPGVGGVVTWDGRDERGAQLGAGLYFARITDGAPGAQARIMMLR